MNEKDKAVELYTVKFDAQLAYKTAQFGITVSAVRGTVEDVNEGMNLLAKMLRSALPSGGE